MATQSFSQGNYHEIRKAISLLKALCHPIRKKIIEFLEADEELSVSELENKLLMEQSIVSQQLAVLRRHHILKTRRTGKNVYYFLNHERILNINKSVEGISLDGKITGPD